MARIHPSHRKRNHDHDARNAQYTGPMLAMALITIASASVAAAAGATDACTPLGQQAIAISRQATSNFSVVSGSDALACYNIFPVTSETRKSQIAAVKTYFNLYPYIDLAQNATSPLFVSKVDLFAGLDSIASDDSITTEYVLHSKINLLISSLYDAHSFYGSYCFTNIRFLQPFVVAAKYPNGAPVIYVKGPVTTTSELFSASNLQVAPYLKGIQSALNTFWKDILGSVDYRNYTISTINGVDAVSYIQSHADKVSGLSKTPEARFNSILPSSLYSAKKFIMGDGGFYRTRQFPHDTPLVMEYELVSPDGTTTTKISAPWAAYLRSSGTTVNINNAADYYNYFCITQSDNTMLQNQTTVVGTAAAEPTSSSAPLKLMSPETLTPSSLTTETPTAASGTSDIPTPQPTAETVQRRSPEFLPSRLSYSSGSSIHPIEEYINDMDAPGFLSQSQTQTQWTTLSGQVPDVNLSSAATTHFTKVSSFRQSFDSQFGSIWLTDFGTTTTSTSAPSMTVPVLYDDYNAFYNLDGTNGLWAFTTVDPQDTSSDGIEKFVTTVTAGLAILEKAGVNNLIIDVSGNGGGVICFGFAFLAFIFKQPKALTYDIRLSESARTLIAYSDMNDTIAGTTFFSQAGLTPVDQGNSDLTKNPIPRIRGTNQPSNYTREFNLDCTWILDPVLNKLPQLNVGWAPQTNMFILSDGTCGSTCAEFVRVARDQFGVRAVTYGGGRNSNVGFQPSSFEGGAVGSFDAILNDTISIVQSTKIPKLDGTSSNGNGGNSGAGTMNDVIGYPVALPLPVMGSVPFWESYSTTGKGGDTVPVEWVPENAEVGLSGILDVTDKVAVWGAAVQAIQSSFAPPSNVGMNGSKKSGAIKGRRDVEVWGSLVAAIFAWVAFYVAL
ncbi:hypothetical protein HDU76_003649 [Blyttiomyces sp. JEL0837]|nr:hypothetical protein HDU76_003649 [Blyttiomyces sp. JEL0837]